MSELASTVARARPPANGISVWSLGQAGFLIRSPEVTVGIDLYLSDWLERESPLNPHPVTRARPRPFPPDELPAMEVVLATHEHPDHLDPGTISVVAAQSSAPWIVVPEPARPSVLALGAPAGQVIGALRDRWVELPGVSVCPVGAAHALHPDAFGGYTFWLDEQGRDRAVGYVVVVNDVRVYHSGDTVYWPGLVERLQELEIDIALLPINGRDWMREREGIVGNLTAPEAAELAWQAGIELIVPCHYDGIVGNTVDPGGFASYLTRRHPTQAFKLLQQGEELRYTR